MLAKSREQLVNELNTAIRSNGQNGATTAADVRSFLSTLIDELINRTDAFSAAAYQNSLFAPIIRNQYGIHPAFSTQAELNSWLLGQVYYLPATTSYSSYNAGGYMGINPDLLAYFSYKVLPAIHDVFFTDNTDIRSSYGYAGSTLTITGRSLTNGIVVRYGGDEHVQGYVMGTLFNASDDGTRASLIVADTCYGTRDEVRRVISTGKWYMLSPDYPFLGTSYFYLGRSDFEWLYPEFRLSTYSAAPNTLITITGKGVHALKSMRLGRTDNGSNTVAVQRDPNDASRVTALVPATAGPDNPNTLYFFMEELQSEQELSAPIATAGFTLLN
jgi:hypothetical protein